MIGFQVAAQVGQVLLSTPLGSLRDHIGYSNTFRVIASIGIYAVIALKKDDTDIQGDAFIRG